MRPAAAGGVPGLRPACCRPVRRLLQGARLAPRTELSALWGGGDRGWGVLRRQPRRVAAPRPTGRSLALRRHRRCPRPTFQARRQPRSRPAAGARCGRLLAFGDAAGLWACSAGAGASPQEPSPGAWLRSGRVAGRRSGAAAACPGCSGLLGANATDIAAGRPSESVSSEQRDRRLRRPAAGPGARASGGSRRRCLHVGGNDAAMRPPTARRRCARGGGVDGLPKLSSLGVWPVGRPGTASGRDERTARSLGVRLPNAPRG